jgi:hypothetical protein
LNLGLKLEEETFYEALKLSKCNANNNNGNIALHPLIPATPYTCSVLCIRHADYGFYFSFTPQEFGIRRIK